jgi:hypothetical protein
MNVYSGSAFPAFRRHVTVCLKHARVRNLFSHEEYRQALLTACFLLGLVKVAAHLHLPAQLECVEPYLHSPTHFRDVSTETTLLEVHIALMKYSPHGEFDCHDRFIHVLLVTTVDIATVGYGLDVRGVGVPFQQGQEILCSLRRPDRL